MENILLLHFLGKHFSTVFNVVLNQKSVRFLKCSEVKRICVYCGQAFLGECSMELDTVNTWSFLRVCRRKEGWSNVHV